jgi:uncharacterized protein (TIGR02145 family)
MNKIFIVLTAVLISASLWAQAPQSFSYQAVIRGGNNVLVSNKPVGIKISLLQGSEKGKAVYVETHKPTSNENGLVSIAIGGGIKDPSSIAFTSIDWSKGPYFVQTETDPAGGTSYSLTSVSQLLSVPYAISSNNGFSRVSLTGDSLILINGNSIIIPGISLSNHTTPTSGYGPNITDAENNTYKTVYIGTQQWMAENLKVSKYNDGTTIPIISDNNQWSQLTSGAWSYYNNDAANNAKYGKLYNWYALSPTTNGDKNVCPTRWHVPTDAEWTVLTDYLGGEIVAGGKLKEVGTTSWNSPNTDATNTSLFSALPGGSRDGKGFYHNIGSDGYWWSSTENGSANIWDRILYNYVGNVYRNGDGKVAGLSVRCIKD